MLYRTDLAEELRENLDIEGIKTLEKEKDGIKISDTFVLTDEAANRLGKPKGRYITIFLESVFAFVCKDTVCDVLTEILSELIPSGDILVSGLGNRKITPDALGPATAERILATRHLTDHLTSILGIKSPRAVSVISPDVLGNTGIATAEILKSLVLQTSPAAVVAIDALAAKNISRLGTTIQLSNTGIAIGSGVGNRQTEITESSLGVPVIAIGVPTVTDLMCITDKECDNQIITLKDIDTVIESSAEIIALSLNRAFQPEITPSDFKALL